MYPIIFVKPMQNDTNKKDYSFSVNFQLGFLNLKTHTMKTLLNITLSICFLTTINTYSQTNGGGEKYGRTLNAGIGIGYYGYLGHSVPVLHFNYELDVARNFTLAPFVTIYRFQNVHYWGNSQNPYQNYTYHETVIPIGLKGTYYFDQLLRANSKWDFYLGASLGFSFRKTTWNSNYYGDRTIDHGTSGLYLDGHIGAEFHVNSSLGLLLDFSTGLSTFCLAIHL